MTTRKGYLKRVFLAALAAAFLLAGAVSTQARLRYIATSDDGSFCAQHFDNDTGVHDFDVCYAVSTGEYTFFDV